MNNVTYISDKAYHDKIKRMPNHELLDEMVRFHEEWHAEQSKSSELITRGYLIFQRLEKTAGPDELKVLALSWLWYLDSVMKDFK